MDFDSILTDLQNIPKSLLNCLKYYISPEGQQKLKGIRNSVKENKIDHIVFIGHSYNHFASYVPFYYINSNIHAKNSNGTSKTSIECIQMEIDEFLTYLRINHISSKTVFIFVSQSGESVQIRQGIDKLKNSNIKIQNLWGVSNNPNSTLAKACLPENFFPLFSGKEEVIGTKAYINAMLVLYLLARSVLGEPGIQKSIEQEIRDLIFEMKFYGQDWEFHTKELNKFLGKDFNFLYFISKGASLGTANQAALNCMAYTRTFAEGISIGLFLHGPFQIVDDSFRCVVIIGDETSVEETIELIELITQKIGKGKVILINNSRKLSSLGRSNENVYVFEHTATNPYLAPMFEIIVVQYLMLRQAKKRGVIN